MRAMITGCGLSVRAVIGVGTISPALLLELSPILRERFQIVLRCKLWRSRSRHPNRTLCWCRG